MCLCTLCTERFLDCVAGSAVFRAYCRRCQIPRSFSLGACPVGEAAARWIEALSSLPEARRLQISREQAAVYELDSGRGVMHLLAAGGAVDLPPADIPDGGPLALWFLLRDPELFWEVFYQHRHPEPDVWHAGRVTAGLQMTNSAVSALAGPLEAFFRRQRVLCGAHTVATHRLSSGVCFVARGAGRPGSIDSAPVDRRFRRPVHPSPSVQIAYYPDDGTILVKASPGPPDTARSLLDGFARNTLGLASGNIDPAFAIDRLRYPFRPLPDDEVEMACVRTLHLRHPARAAGRSLILQSQTSDAPSAVDEMLARYVGPAELVELQVSHAELHVRLRVAGRPKDHLVRLWPDRCDVGTGASGDRILRSLRRWGL